MDFIKVDWDKIAAHLEKFNTAFTLRITVAMGTIWCVYAFILLSLLPLFISNVQGIVMYLSSSVIQLVALPIIMVGQNQLSAKSEQRAQDDHDTLMNEFQDIKDLQTRSDIILTMLEQVLRQTKQAPANLLTPEVVENTQVIVNPP